MHDSKTGADCPSSRLPRAGHRYEVAAPLAEGRELLSLFIEAFPDRLTDNKKNENKCVLQLSSK